MSSAAATAVQPPSRLLMALELRALHELGAFFGALPLLNLAPRGDGHPVLVLPGLVMSDESTVLLRAFLKRKGYVSYGWEQGRNFGPRAGVEQTMIDQVRRLADTHGRKVSLVGWSLGGIYARQLAKILPDDLRSVITLGSPFAGDPRATNAWRIFEFVSGMSVDQAQTHMSGHIADVPAVPTSAIFSRTDGIAAWRICMETEGPQTENIEVYGSHCGLGHHPAAVYAIADRLAQPEGAWSKFDRSGWRRSVYPDPQRPG